MKKLGKELIFISMILRDGSGTKDCLKLDMCNLDNERFEINCLSISHGTYIASGFNSYVVKINTQPSIAY